MEANGQFSHKSLPKHGGESLHNLFTLAQKRKSRPQTRETSKKSVIKIGIPQVQTDSGSEKGSNDSTMVYGTLLTIVQQSHKADSSLDSKIPFDNLFHAKTRNLSIVRLDYD